MIPIAKPIIAKNAKKYLLACLDSGWVSSKGPYVERFENAFAKWAGTKYAIAVNSGTAALHLSLAALHIGQNDEVIAPTLTMIASVLPIIYVGAKPVLIDSEPDTGNLDVSRVEKKITSRTKAIIAIHLNGHPADLNPLLKIAKSHNLALIEDAAEAQGAEYKTNKGDWRMAGSIGDLGCFSFYGNKVITTGEGGMVTTDSKKLADKIRNLRNLDRSPKKHFYHQSVAFTYRMSNLQAALGLAQLEEVDRFLKIKQRLADIYINSLKKSRDLTLPTEKDYAKRIYWNFDILTEKRDKLARLMEKNGVETRVFVVPIHRQPAFNRLGFFKNESYPVADSLSSSGISLPLGLALKKKDVKQVCTLINRTFNEE